MVAPSLFNKLIYSRQFEYRNGGFYLMSEIPGVILPLEVFVRLIKRMSADKEEKIIYEIGYNQGVSAGKRYKGMTGHTVIEFMNFVKESAAMVGMGNIEFKRFDDKEIVITVNPAPLPEEWIKIEGVSKKPICNYILGIAAGCFVGYTGKKWVGKEVACKATGKPQCEFKFATKK